MRPTVADDVPELVTLVDAVAAEDRWLLVQPGQRSAIEEHLLLTQVNATGGLSLTLDVATQVAGRVVVARQAHGADQGVGEVAILLAARVRGQGLGRALLDHAVGWARSAGLAATLISVAPHSQQSRCTS